MTHAAATAPRIEPNYEACHGCQQIGTPDGRLCAQCTLRGRAALPTLDGAERERELLDALKVAYATQARARINREHAIRALDETAVESAAADTAVEQLNDELSAHLRGLR